MQSNVHVFQVISLSPFLSLFHSYILCSVIHRFYTLLVLSTALFDKPPFKNLIVNGLVLAADGQKMSKRKKNYPDPMDIVHKFGSDALRSVE